MSVYNRRGQFIMNCPLLLYVKTKKKLCDYLTIEM